MPEITSGIEKMNRGQSFSLSQHEKCEHKLKLVTLLNENKHFFLHSWTAEPMIIQHCYS